jgi:hypothetical protein
MITLCTNGSTQGSQSIFLTDEAVLPCIDGVLTPKYTDTIGLRQQVQISKGPEAGYRSCIINEWFSFTNLVFVATVFTKQVALHSAANTCH